jgi:hypothetical protein
VPNLNTLNRKKQLSKNERNNIGNRIIIKEKQRNKKLKGKKKNTLKILN